MSTPKITINNITFFLIRVVDNLHPRYSDVLEIHSHELDKDPFSFWVYRSNSELGFWRLCVTKSNSLQSLLWYKGTADYVQATFIHLELQHFINQNIQYVPKVQLDDIEKLSDCVCYINTRYCSSSNKLATEHIDNPERIISEEPFSNIQSYDDDARIYPIGCGRIPRGFTNDRIKVVLEEFSEHLESEYKIENVSKVCFFSFNFEKIMKSVGEIYCITLKRKIILKDSQTNNILIYFLKTKLDIDPSLITTPTLSQFTSNITRICSKEYHVFPFFITNTDATITNMGLYSKYIPSGIFICKLFDYYVYDQCTLEEMRDEKCTQHYSYIGKRYDDLFPLNEAVEKISETCHMSTRPLSRESRKSRDSRESRKSRDSKESQKSWDSRESYETITSQPQLRSLRKRFYKDFKKLKHFHKINKSKKKRNVIIRRSRRNK